MKNIIKIIKTKYLQAVVVVYFAILFILNCLRITGTDFWLDETFSIYGIKMNSAGELIKYLARGDIDLFPPLYYFIARIICNLFGYNGVIYQIVSIIPLIIIIFFSYFKLSKVFGLDACVVFVTFCSLFRNALTYNIEVRCYSWAALFVLLAFYELNQVIRYARKKDFIALVLFSVLGAYTHYFALLTICFFYLGIIVYFCFIKKTKILETIISSLVSIIFYLPWVTAVLMGYFQKLVSVGSGKYHTDSFFSAVEYLFSGRWYCPFYMAILLGGSLIATLYNVGVLVVEDLPPKKKIAIPRVNKENVKTDYFDTDIVWILIGLIAVFGTAFVGYVTSKLTVNFFITRYMYPASIVAWLIVAILPSKLANRRLISTLSLVVMLSIGMLYYCKYYRDTMLAFDNENVTLNEIEVLGEEYENVIVFNEVLHKTQAEYYFSNFNNSFVNGILEDKDREKPAILIVSDEDATELLSNQNGISLVYQGAYLGQEIIDILVYDPSGED